MELRDLDHDEQLALLGLVQRHRGPGLVVAEAGDVEAA